jgi:hypothetical protein
MRNEANSGVVPGGVLGLRADRAGGVGGRLRNEPNFRVFRFGRISYGGVHVGLVLPAESLAAFQFRKVAEEGSLGIDDVTMEAVEGVGVGGGAGVFAGDGFVSGVDTGFESVHARDGFALPGARTGGEMCIAAIGLNLFLDCHRASSHDGSRRARAFSGVRTASD